MIPIQIGKQNLLLPECSAGGNHLTLALTAYQKFKGDGVYMSAILCNDCKQSIAVQLKEGVWKVAVEAGWSINGKPETHSSCFPVFQSKESTVR